MAAGCAGMEVSDEDTGGFCGGLGGSRAYSCH